MKLAYKIASILRKTKGQGQCYFMLPILGDLLNSEVFLTNSVQNTTKPFHFKNIIAVAHIFDHTKSNWKNLRSFNFDDSGCLIIKSSYFSLPIRSLVVISIQKNNFDLSANLENLPDSFIKKNDFSPHTIRCRLGFYKKKAYSSYMSEYPSKMTFIPSGSSFSYGHLLKYQAGMIYSYIAFINISRLNLSQNGTMRVLDIDSGEPIFLGGSIKNKVNLIKVDAHDLKNKNLALFVDGMVGVPIYISVFKNSRNDFELSVEHSHPPAEYFFNEANKYQNILKKCWFNKFS